MKTPIAATSLWAALAALLFAAGVEGAEGQKRILVTGGTSGIGLALCKKLVLEHGCHVYLGARAIHSGKAQQAYMQLASGHPEMKGRVELVQLDVTSDTDIAAAVDLLKELPPLYAIVNNAGIGLSTAPEGDVKTKSEAILQTNYQGAKKVTEAFLPLLDPTEGRVVNVGSGSGPGFVKSCGFLCKALLTSFDVTPEQIDSVIASEEAAWTQDAYAAYGLSKACLTAYTMVLARTHPNIKSNACSPGFIDTAMTLGYGARLAPAEGTVSILHLLFSDTLRGNGWFYGSDAKRSPLNVPRDPGTPEYMPADAGFGQDSASPMSADQHPDRKEGCDDQGPGASWFDKRRRLLEAGVAPNEAWDEEWSRRISCWWIGLPLPTQSQMGACMGALGVHIASRLDVAFRAAQTTLGQRPAASQPRSTASDASCEWISETSAELNLPSFPDFGEGFEFSLPPIPRLLPSGQMLQSLSKPAKPTSTQVSGSTTPMLLGVSVGGVSLGAALTLLMTRRR
tara:strand:- start:1286 stop:2815 length:1530 start_codon:yes stop_codon:yes gene_type:complete